MHPKTAHLLTLLSTEDLWFLTDRCCYLLGLPYDEAAFLQIVDEIHHNADLELKGKSLKTVPCDERVIA